MRLPQVVTVFLYVTAIHHIFQIQALDMKACSLKLFDDCEKFLKYFYTEIGPWAWANSVRGFDDLHNLHLLNATGQLDPEKCYVYVPLIPSRTYTSGMNFDIAKEKCEGARGMIPWFPEAHIQSEEAKYLMAYVRQQNRTSSNSRNSIWTGLTTQNTSGNNGDWYWMCPNKLIKAEDRDIEWGPNFPKSNVTNKEVGIMVQDQENDDIKMEHETRDDETDAVPWFCVAFVVKQNISTEIGSGPVTSSSTNPTAVTALDKNVVWMILVLVLLVTCLLIFGLLLYFELKRRREAANTEDRSVSVIHQLYNEDDLGLGDVTPSTLFQDTDSEMMSVVETDKQLQSWTLVN